jgi:hypothetical protein
LPNDDQADLFEADGVTPKAPEKPVITAEQLEAEKRAAAAEGEAKGLKEALKAIPAKEKPKAEAKEFTRAELRAQVNDGKITEDQMDDILERQLEAKLTKKAEEIAERKISSSQTAISVADQIAAYVGVYPDINKEGSATRAKIQAAFDELVGLKDDPSALTTELKAIKMALGPLKAGAGRRPAPEAHEDVGAGSDSDSKPAEGWAKGLSPKLKKHYEKQIDRGIYKSHSDPRLIAELKYARGRPN